MNYLHLSLSARLAYGDLVEIDRELSDDKCSKDACFVLVKHALISATNLVDLERSIVQMYREHPELADDYKRIEKNLKFAKYLRNIVVGHMNDRLLAKAIEWQPVLRFLISENYVAATYLINLFLLETAINTYVDASGNHRIFDSETDLAYPPDHTRFYVYLTETVRGGIEFLAKLIAATRGHTPEPPQDFEYKAMLAIKAGQTDFKLITKDRG
jgi:hypothetical protein